jgi:hemerythrin-like metal-binding protein
MQRESEGAASNAEAASSAELADHCTRELSSRLARFLAAIERARGADPIELLHFLGSYVSEDLLVEEAAIRSTSFPDAEPHLREHEAFRAAFAGLVKAYARYGNDPRITDQLRVEALAWLESHVQISDRALCEFIHALDPGRAGA